MNLSIRLLISAAIVTLAACGGGSDALDPGQACGEQAFMFCNASNPDWAVGDCRTAYMQDCMPANPGIAIDSHVTCLEAITQADGSHCVPLACAATWGDPDRVAHFCRI